MLAWGAAGPPLALLPQAMAAGACGLLATAALQRVAQAAHRGVLLPSQQRHYAAALVEPTAYPRPGAEHFQYAVLSAPLMKEGPGAADALPRHLLPFAARLGGMGGQRAPAAGEQAYQAALTAAHEGQPLALLVGTGGTEGAILESARRYHREYLKAQQALAGEVAGSSSRGAAAAVPPLLLLAHPFANSLPSALEALARLQQDGHRGRILYLPAAAPGTADEAWDGVAAALRGVRAWHRLHRSRIGMVGAPSEWLVASTPSAQAVRASWGPQLVGIDIQELMDGLQDGSAFKQAEVEAAVQDMLGGAGGAPHTHGDAQPADGCPACGAAAVEAEPAAKVYLALRRLVDAHALSCLSVRCFDVVTAKQTTGCYSLARLLDEQVIAGCEGDVCSALGMLWGQLLTGQVPWMANVAQVDPAGGTLKLAHCTIARSLLSSYTPATHFESGQGVAIRGRVPPGAVTLLRIGGAALDRLWVEEGYAREGAAPGAEWSPQLCRTQVQVSLLGGRPAVEQLLQRPLGNHVVLLRGHHRAALEGYWSQFGPGFDATQR